MHRALPVFLVAVAVAASAHAQTSAGVRAVPTYESVGLYWSNPGANSATGCEVKFRAAGETSFRQGLAMWFDARNNECRGSLVLLDPGTSYEVQLGLPGQAPSAGISVSGTN